MPILRTVRNRISLRLERRKLQVRALWKARELSVVRDLTATMPSGPILFSTVRNEAVRLPYFLDYYRRLGVVQFLIVDNGSEDGTQDLLTAERDVSLWHTSGSYKSSRFGVDWLNALLTRYGHGRWVLVADPDEFLVFPHIERGLAPLIRWLESTGAESFGVMLLDMYGDGSVAHTHCRVGQDPIAAAPYFDSANYMVTRDAHYQNLWIQGGPRQRVFFKDHPQAAPALNKIPLVRWRRGFVYKAGAHDLLPRRLNRTYARTGGSRTSGVFLHAKFMDVLNDKVAEEVTRRQHYADSAEYASYAGHGSDLCLCTPHSVRFKDWQQLCDLGLMARGGWL
ncbi:MAG: glycosyltransferase family 2 protein [Pseudomonadota bacterium]